MCRFPQRLNLSKRTLFYFIPRNLLSQKQPLGLGGVRWVLCLPRAYGPSVFEPVLFAVHVQWKRSGDPGFVVEDVPYAELWIGTHPSAPSCMHRGEVCWSGPLSPEAWTLPRGVAYGEKETPLWGVSDIHRHRGVVSSTWTQCG